MQEMRETLGDEMLSLMDDLLYQQPENFVALFSVSSKIARQWAIASRLTSKQPSRTNWYNSCVSWDNQSMELLQKQWISLCTVLIKEYNPPQPRLAERPRKYHQRLYKQFRSWLGAKYIECGYNQCRSFLFFGWLLSVRTIGLWGCFPIQIQKKGYISTTNWIQCSDFAAIRSEGATNTRTNLRNDHLCAFIGSKRYTKIVAKSTSNKRVSCSFS